MKAIVKLIVISISGALIAGKSLAIGYGCMKDGLLELQISNRGPTRIHFDNTAITDTFFYPEEAAKIAHHDSGSIFVVPNNEYKHVYVTVIGEGGVVQDLKLRFCAKEPNPVAINCQSSIVLEESSQVVIAEGEAVNKKTQLKK
jgi:hypothetical protein